MKTGGLRIGTLKQWAPFCVSKNVVGVRESASTQQFIHGWLGLGWNENTGLVGGWRRS